MDSGVGHSIALLAGIAVFIVVVTILNKIHNPSPPPPEEGGNHGSEPSDQDRNGGGSDDPRGDVDHARPSWAGTHIPNEPPDIILASRVGWYEDDPEDPARTSTYWVTRHDWDHRNDRGGDDESDVPRWLSWLGF